jgi:hypothetical protein
MMEHLRGMAPVKAHKKLECWNNTETNLFAEHYSSYLTFIIIIIIIITIKHYNIITHYSSKLEFQYMQFRTI